jgi:spore coat protein U-like protein
MSRIASWAEHPRRAPGWRFPALLSLVALTLLLAPRLAAALAECQVSADAVDFSLYDPSRGSPTDTVGNVQVRCSLLGLASVLVSYDIHLSTGASGSYAPRHLTSGGHRLQYNLYTTAARTQVWGDGSGGTAVVSDSYLLGLLTVTRNYSVYGRLGALQNVPSGTYGDTITVTVHY